MKKRIVAVDIDEVLAPFVETFLLMFNQKHNTNYSRKDVFSYDLHNVTGLPESYMTQQILEFYQTPEFKEMPPIPGSREGLERIAQTSDIICPTARPYSIETITQFWIQKRFPNRVQGIHHTNEYPPKPGKIVRKKVDLCKYLNADTIIEDSLRNAWECSEAGLDVYLIDCPWNQNHQGVPISSKIKRVKNWEELIRIFK